MKLIPTIGLEVHVELKTKSKMFCGCDAAHFLVAPNTHTCPVCLGLPGALPVPNKTAIDWTGMIALALGCTINKESKFDRKHYFYPDLAKGYQISQYDQPIGVNGHLNLSGGRTIKIRRVHLEEDTGKLQHQKVDGEEVSLVDFNRSGVPLVEIVSDPDITSGVEAKEYLKKIRDILRAMQVSDCDMEKGLMRLELNISLRSGKELADYKVEVKNLNSFRFGEQAINYEIARQTEILEKGGTPKQETRGYNPKTRQTFVQRSKEEAEDYRYFPEPDIPPLVFDDKLIAGWQAKLPQLPEETANELVSKYGLKPDSAAALAKDPVKLSYFNQQVDKAKPQDLANLIINKKVDLTKSLSGQLKQPAGEVDEAVIDQVLKENGEAVAKYKSGKTQVIGFLVGQIMKAAGGKADPGKVMLKLRDKMS